MALEQNNFFVFFGLEVAFAIDEKLLKERYYENTRKYHPDHFGQADATQQAEALELTTLNNNAYKTLKKFDKRVHYILDMNDLVTEGEKHTLSPAFLGEMMEVNEALMELEFEPDTEKLKATKNEVLVWEAQIKEELKNLGDSFDASASEEEKSKILQQVKEAYHKSKYILRLKETLHKFAAL